MPHGHCFLWQPGLLWLHVISDALIGAAYFSIPVALLVLVRRRDDLSFGLVFQMFACFIFFCGASHVTEIYTMWVPAYWFEGAIKVLTAISSVGTALLVWPLLPKAISIPSRSRLEETNRQLEEEVAQRQETQRELQELNNELEEKVAERTAKLEQLANTDPLTGLRNRRYLMERLDEELARAQRHDSKLSLLVIDLDGFGEINDEYGHLYGDRLLSVVGEVLEESTRESDVAARLGGDEFSLILPETCRSDAEASAERVAEALASVPLPTPESTQTEVDRSPSEALGASMGIAEYDDGDVGVNGLIRRADEAMYGAKEEGLAQASWTDSEPGA